MDQAVRWFIMGLCLWGAMLYGLYEAQKEEKMKFAGQKLRKCYNPFCSTMTTRTEVVKFKNGRSVVLHVCVSCKPVIHHGNIDWEKR